MCSIFLAGRYFTNLKSKQRVTCQLFRQMVGIRMGTNYVPLLADLFLYSYENEYLNKELLIAFYDLEKCSDSLWLEDCINSLWALGVKDDTLFLIYLMNTEASVTIKTPMGDTCPLILSNLVKQGTVLGPLLNNYSLDRFSKESFGYNFGSVGIQALEFVDDIANPRSSRKC